MAGLQYARRNAAVRGLTLGTLVFVTFAAIDNVALVFLVSTSRRRCWAALTASSTAAASSP
jgi:hypothetical protein